MTELLPNADKVEVALDSEEVTVPTGKVWVVTTAAATNEELVLESASGESNIILDGTDSRANSIAEDITVHEDWVIGRFGGTGIVTGWQFDYSE